MTRQEYIVRIRDGRTDLVLDYCQLGHDPQACDDQGVPFVNWCAYYGDVTAVKFMIREGASLASLGDNYDLNGASFHGHWQLCQYLIESGADVRFTLKDTGETALHNAVSKGNHPAANYLARLLLHHGADPNARTVPGVETGAFMRNALTRGETPLHRAAAFGNAETIRILLEGGADKTIADAYGESPIGWASWHERPGQILALLAHGEHRIHPLHEERMLKDHGFGWSGGMDINLLGRIHLE